MDISMKDFEIENKQMKNEINLVKERLDFMY